MSGSNEYEEKVAIEKLHLPEIKEGMLKGLNQGGRNDYGSKPSDLHQSLHLRENSPQEMYEEGPFTHKPLKRESSRPNSRRSYTLSEDHSGGHISNIMEEQHNEYSNNYANRDLSIRSRSSSRNTHRQVIRKKITIRNRRDLKHKEIRSN